MVCQDRQGVSPPPLVIDFDTWGLHILIHAGRMVLDDARGSLSLGAPYLYERRNKSLPAGIKARAVETPILHLAVGTIAEGCVSVSCPYTSPLGLGTSSSAAMSLVAF